MNTSPISYWRQSQKQIPLLGQEGKIISFTKINNQYIAIIKLTSGQKLTAPLIFNTKKPQIGDLVKGVLRILKKPNSKDLIEYGVKFQFIKEV